MKLEFSQQIFEKYSDIKFHEMPSSGRGVVLCGQTDGYEEANSRFSENWEPAWKWVGLCLIPALCLQDVCMDKFTFKFSNNIAASTSYLLPILTVGFEVQTESEIPLWFV